MAITERYCAPDATFPAWANATAYTTTPLSIVLGTDGYGYYCSTAHTSETGVKGAPITGTDWATYWTICDGSETKPWTLKQAFATVTKGDRVNVKKGAYARGAADTPTADGDAATPIIFRGYNTAIGDLDAVGRVVATGLLDTTNFPVITYASTYALTISGMTYSILACMKFVGTKAAALIGGGGTNIAYRLHVDNASTDAAAIGITSCALFLDCDVNMSGASGTTSAFTLGSFGKAISCRVIATPGNAFVTASSGVCIGCVVDSCGGDGFTHGATAGNLPPLLYNCTVYAAGGDAISLGNALYTAPLVVLNCHLTDSTGYAINSDYVGTGNLMAVLGFNRTRDNAGGLFNGITDWAAATTWEHVTTDTGGIATDCVDGPGGDFRLISAAPAKSAGIPKYTDIGACQRAEPTYPAAGDVDSTAAAYGDTVSQTTPTFTVPAVGDVRSGTTYGAGGTEFTGTLAGSGGGLPLLGGSVVT